MIQKRMILGAACAAILAGLALSGCDNGSTGDEAGPVIPQVVCLGDSLTTGYNATNEKIDIMGKAYPAWLQEKLAVPVINLGVTADTTADALDRIDTVSVLNPEVVIIELGANDFFRLTPASETLANLTAIISILSKPGRKIYLAKFYTEEVARSFTKRYGITDEALQTAFINLYDGMFNSLALLGVELIPDIWTGVWGNYMSDDGIHPGIEGCRIMADHYFDAIKPYAAARYWLK